MGLESANFIDDLNPLWPLETDFLLEADDHMQMIKRSIQGSFPNLSGAMNASSAELNLLVGETFFVSELSELSDVNTSTPTNRNVLVADGVDWESRALVKADVSDLSTTPLVLNQDIIFDELADHASIPAAGKGILWLRDTGELVFTDPGGTDVALGAAGAGGDASSLGGFLPAQYLRSDVDDTFTGNLSVVGTFDVSGALYHGAGNQTLDSTGGISTLSGGLTVTGAFLSPGIDDNATVEQLQISDDDLAIGGVTPFATSKISLRNNNHRLEIHGGLTGQTNPTLELVGGSNGGDPRDIRFKIGTDIKQHWDESAGAWLWYTGTGASTFAFSLNNSQVATFGGASFVMNNYTFEADQTVGAGQDNMILTYNDGTGLISLEAGGNVTKVGTPVADEIAVWTGDGTLEGEANVRWDGTRLILGSSTTTSTLRLDGNVAGSPKLEFYQNGIEKGFVQYQDTGDELTIQSDGIISLISDVVINGGASYDTFSLNDGTTRSLNIGQNGTIAYITAANTAAAGNQITFRTANPSGAESNVASFGQNQEANFYGQVFMAGLLRCNDRLEIKEEYSEAVQSYTVTVGNKIINITNGTYAYPAAAMTAVAVDFTFQGSVSGSLFSWMLELNNMIANTDATPWPAAVTWGDAGEPTWTAGVQVVCFWTRDGGTTIHGALAK